jgi:hypothetical protein
MPSYKPNSSTNKTFKSGLRPETKRPGNTRKAWKPLAPGSQPRVPAQKKPVANNNLVNEFKKLPFMGTGLGYSGVPKKPYFGSGRYTQSAGYYRVFYGKITDKQGKKYTDADFNEKDKTLIAMLLSKHVLKFYRKALIVKDGFGGENRSGMVAVRFKGSLGPMNFTIYGSKADVEYTMTFDTFDDFE